MPRSTARNIQDTQEPRNYRTNPFRRTSGFIPAQRVGQPTSRETEEEEQDDEVGRGRMTSSNQPLTKGGFPDRRYKGQRDLPPPEDPNPNFQRARTGGVVDDMHVTIDGKPDRRFKENRGLSEEEANQLWLDQLNKRYGRTR